MYRWAIIGDCGCEGICTHVEFLNLNFLLTCAIKEHLELWSIYTAFIFIQHIHRIYICTTFCN